MLRMIERDAKVKTAPERWQDEQSVAFQLVVTFDRRVFESVVDGLFLSSCFFSRVSEYLSLMVNPLLRAISAIEPRIASTFISRWHCQNCFQASFELYV